MNINDLLELTRKGWTKEDILKLSGLEQGAPTKEEKPKEEPKKEEVKVEEPKKEEKPVEVEQNNSDVLKAIQNLTSIIQMNALNSSNQPKVESAEDILAQIINPPSNS